MTNCFYTKRLICRQIEAKDADLITEWANSQSAHGDHLSVENETTAEILEKLKNNCWWNDKTKTYLLETKDSILPIGTIKYWSKPGNIFNTALMAIKIAVPEYRRQGFGSEAQKALVRECFKKYHFETIEMYTDINNLPQRKCLAKLDFDEVKLEDFYDAGVLRQGYLYRLTKEKYEKSGVHIFYYE